MVYFLLVYHRMVVLTLVVLIVVALVVVLDPSRQYKANKSSRCDAKYSQQQYSKCRVQSKT